MTSQKSPLLPLICSQANGSLQGSKKFCVTFCVTPQKRGNFGTDKKIFDTTKRNEKHRKTL